MTIRLTDSDLRLVSVRANRRSLRGAYGLSGQHLTRGGSGDRFILNAVQTIPRGSYRAAQRQARKEGRTLSDLAREAVARYIRS